MVYMNPIIKYLALRLTTTQHDCAGDRPTASPATHTDLDQHESTVFTASSYVRPRHPALPFLLLTWRDLASAKNNNN